MKRTARLLLLMLPLLLAACGFHLRGQNDFAMPFKSLYLRTSSDSSPFIKELKGALRFSNIQIAEKPADAELTLEIVSEVADRQILSLSGAGRVQEYRLQYRVSLRAYDSQRQEWLSPEEISLRRDYSYDDSQVLAKEQEEALLYKNMRSDAVQQVLRRLTHAHPQQ